MLIFGTRGKQRAIQLNPDQALIFIYRYFHIFWLLRFAYGGRYELATMTEAGWAYRPVTEQEAAQLTGGNLPKKSVWDQWSLIFGIVMLFLPNLVALITR